MEPTVFKVTSGKAAGATIEVADELVLGRNASDTGKLGDDPELSREHARIARAAGGGVTIDDLGSFNGTFVNGRKITSTTTLHEGDRVEVGGTELAVVSIGGDRQAVSDDATHVREVPTDDQTLVKGILPVDDGTRIRERPPVAAAAPPHVPHEATLPPLPGGPLPTAPRKQGGGPPAALIAGVLALLVGFGVSALIFSGSDDDAMTTVTEQGTEASPTTADSGRGVNADPGGASVEAEGRNFSLMAQGYSIEMLDEETKQRQIDIYLRVVGAPHGIESLALDKYLDETDLSAPKALTYDAIYTFTAGDGDSISLAAEGDVTGPEGPDGVFGQTYEKWRVANGTGRFTGACGAGTITTAFVIAGRVDATGEPTGSNVVKFIEGDLQLGQDGRPVPNCATPPVAPADEGSIGGYEFDTPQMLTEAVEARRGAGRYINEPNALADGFVPQPNADGAVCSRTSSGNGAVEYVNAENVADGKADPAKPDALLYVPVEGAIRRLAGIQYRVPNGGDPISFLGEKATADRPLNAWLFLYNPDGLTANGNPLSTCAAGAVQDTPPIVPAAGPPPDAG